MSETIAPELTPQERTIVSPSLPSLEPRVISILHEPDDLSQQAQKEVNPTPDTSVEEST